MAVSDELLYVLLNPVRGQWRTSVMTLAGDLGCGALPGLDGADAATAKTAFEELLRREYGLDEPVDWQPQEDGWGANIRGTGLQPEHAGIVTAAREQDVRFVRALHTKTKRIIDTGPLESEFITRTMRRRAKHLGDKQQTFGPIEDYLADLQTAAAQHQYLTHVICVVPHAASRTVHSALLTADRSRVVAELDHWLHAGDSDGVPESLAFVWDSLLAWYRDTDNDLARFNVELLEQLRERWGASVRPDRSMWTMLFTVPGETGYQFTNRVEVVWQSPDRVEMKLVSDQRRRSLTEPGGRAVVTGDFTRPENALPAVEALLWQLAEPAPHADGVS